jgi:hypothetical protein
MGNGKKLAKEFTEQQKTPLKKRPLGVADQQECQP